MLYLAVLIQFDHSALNNTVSGGSMFAVSIKMAINVSIYEYMLYMYRYGYSVEGCDHPQRELA